jgi:SepF-like predicted cell division protein (DUF552 family)
MFTASVDRGRRTIVFRASGTVKVDEAKRMFEEAKWAHGVFAGADHIVLADLRGLSPMADDAAAVFGELIGYGRAHGCTWCVHLSDSVVSRLQTARLAREASKDDKVTINVVSIEEADRVIEEKQAILRGTLPR